MNERKESRISYRGTPELRRRLRSLAAEKDTSVQQILDLAVSSYLSGNTEGTLHAVTPPPEDPSIAPVNDHERRILIAALKFMRDKQTPEHFKQLLDYLLDVEPDKPGRKRA